MRSRAALLPTEQERPGYALLDAGAGARLGARVEVQVVGRNLLDEAYLASPDARATLAPGRSGAATLAVTF
jgi:outer membrane receptor protein involved in Fe transport